MASREEKAKKEPSLMLMSAMNFISGTVGGGCEAVVGYPLETIKARMQTQKATTAAAFSGPLDCLQKSIRHEGISSLYRGATPQIFRSAVR
jgi:solute carrier family 25 carnitine/acylcarnitine transporter 20/29